MAAVDADARRGLGVAFLLALLVQLPLCLNPGYLSHDELQWGAFADVAAWADLPWVSWTDVSTFQFRPLTFNLWLVLSHALFDTPRAFHLLFVLLGSCNALLLFDLLRRRLGRGAALLGMVVFLLAPYTAWTHGWVATLAELLWLGLALTAVQVIERADPAAPTLRIGVAVFVLTALALLAKEAALAIPALLALGWWLARRAPVWLAATIGSMLAALLYLGLRLEPLSAGTDSGPYSWGLLNPPWRLAEYFVFPWTLSRFEPFALWSGSLRRPLLAVLLLALFAHGLWRRAPALPWRWALAATLALGPTLVLGAASSQYGYGFAAVTAAAAAHAWQPGERWRLQAALLFALAVWCWHGVQIQLQVLQVGSIQSRFQPSLAATLQAQPGVLRLYADPKQRWIYQRLTHQIPSWRGVPIGNRVQLVDTEDQASHLVRADGNVQTQRGRLTDSGY